MLKTFHRDPRLVALAQVEDASDLSDLELIQHMNMDLARLTKLLNGTQSQVLNAHKALVNNIVVCNGHSFH